MSLDSWNRGPRYRWRERKADRENPRSRWPLRIEFGLLAVSALLAIGSWIVSLTT